MGIDVIEYRGSLQWGAEIDTLADAAIGRMRDGTWRQRLIVATPPVSQVGWAREVLFFPFDSAASYYYPCRFLAGVDQQGTDRYNLDPTQRSAIGGLLRERVYDVATTNPGTAVAATIAFGFDRSRHVRWWPIGPYDDDSVRVTDEFYRRNDLDVSHDHRTMYVVATGHLFDRRNGGRPFDLGLTDTLLAIDVLLLIPQGSAWLDADGVRRTADSNMEILYTRCHVTKTDLRPAIEGRDTVHERYRSIAFCIDMKRQGDTGVGGPFHDDNSGHRMDLRVRWTGKEKLALRSIALRDTMAYLLTDPDGAGFRAEVIDTVERILRGYGWHDTAATNHIRDDRMGKIIRLYTGDEGTFLRNVGFNWLDSTLYRRYNWGDSVTRGLRAYRAQTTVVDGDAPTMTSQNEITVETYATDFWHIKGEWSDVVRRNQSRQSWMGGQAEVRYGLPDSVQAPPSIVEHNGGRFYIPIIDLGGGSPRAAVDLYTRALQRMTYGAYITGHARSPYRNGAVNGLGRAAFISRRTGRRIILWPGVHTTLHLWTRQKNGVGYRDTLIGHVPEAAEIRANVNIGFCYGIQGIEYSYLGANANEYGAGNEFAADYGPIGPTTADTLNVVDLVLHTPSHISPPRRDTIPGFYTGWGNRLREIRWLNRHWVPRLWEHMRDLRWRDGYSMHFTTEQTYVPAGEQRTQQMIARPLDSNEVVTAVMAIDRYDRVDEPLETYVELGLFDSRPGIAGYDTSFAFVCNRRTFERPEDVDASTARGRLMDSLAEVRRVVIALNLSHPDTTNRYRLYHVVELAPDTTPLPQVHPTSTSRRVGVDTLLFVGDRVSVTLRPGGGALLKMYPVAPPPSSTEPPSGMPRDSGARSRKEGAGLPR